MTAELDREARTYPDVVDQGLVDQLVRILDVETIDDDVFRGVSPHTALQRVFGGQVAGQALIAAGRTVPPHPHVHSLHSYFIRPGDPAHPILYTVDRARDGRSFSVRRVVAVQHGQTIFVLSSSFQAEQPGIEHGAAMPDVPPPHELPTMADVLADLPDGASFYKKVPNPIDIRYVDGPPWRPGYASPTHRMWLRAKGRLPDDPLLHVCVATFASDYNLLEAALVRGGLTGRADDIPRASLDHAMWCHHPVRFDDWVLYDTASPAAAGGRALTQGVMFTADGRDVATVLQEGMLRVPTD